MAVLIANMILLVAATYTGVGLAIGIAFVVAGVNKVDRAAAGAPASFRLVILPGAIALWPLVARAWLRAGREARP